MRKGYGNGGRAVSPLPCRFRRSFSPELTPLKFYHKEIMIAPWYVMAYTKLERIAWRHGYALALHGSMARDLDLIAVPWTEDADEPEKLIAAFKRFIIIQAPVSFRIAKPTKKPHGRLAYVVPIGFDGHYLDLSIMPRRKGR